MMESKLDEVIAILKKMRIATQNHNANEIMNLSISFQKTVTEYLTEK